MDPRGVAGGRTRQLSQPAGDAGAQHAHVHRPSISVCKSGSPINLPQLDALYSSPVPAPDSVHSLFGSPRLVSRIGSENGERFPDSQPYVYYAFVHQLPEFRWTIIYWAGTQSDRSGFLRRVICGVEQDFASFALPPSRSRSTQMRSPGRWYAPLTSLTREACLHTSRRVGRAATQ